MDKFVLKIGKDGSLINDISNILTMKLFEKLGTELLVLEFHVSGVVDKGILNDIKRELLTELSIELRDVL